MCARLPARLTCALCSPEALAERIKQVLADTSRLQAVTHQPTPSPFLPIMLTPQISPSAPPASYTNGDNACACVLFVGWEWEWEGRAERVYHVQVGEEARRRALAWGEEEFASQLLSLIASDL